MKSVGEVSAMGGGTAGGLKTHPVITGSAGVSLSRYLMLLGETSVIPLSNWTLIPTAAVQVRGSDLFDFNIALQGRIPIKKWEPYGVFGMAVLMNPYTAGILTPSGAVAYVGAAALEVWPGVGRGLPVLRQGQLGNPDGVSIHVIHAQLQSRDRRTLLPVRLPAIQLSSRLSPGI